MKQREFGWHIVLYNIKRNIIISSIYNEIMYDIRTPSTNHDLPQERTNHFIFEKISKKTGIAKEKLKYAYKDPNQLIVGLQNAVQDKDISKIIMHFDEGYQDKYRSLFEANVDKLSELSEYLTTLEEIKTGETETIVLN